MRKQKQNQYFLLALLTAIIFLMVGFCVKLLSVNDETAMHLSAQSAYVKLPGIGLVYAGPDQVVYEGDLVTLQGSSLLYSEDPELNRITAMHWSMETDPWIILSDNTSFDPTFVAPLVESGDSQTHIFKLNIWDNSDPRIYYSDTVEITVLNKDDADDDGICDGPYGVKGVCSFGPDNCPLRYNTNQFDADGDEIGDACDDWIYNESTTEPLLAFYDPLGLYDPSDPYSEPPFSIYLKISNPYNRSGFEIDLDSLATDEITIKRGVFSYLIADPDTSLGAVGFPRPESIVFQIGLDPITLTTRFVNPAGLRSLGKNLFSPTNVSGGYNATTGHPVLYTNEATVIIIANATREGARAGIVFADPRPSSSTVSTGQESWTNLTVEEGNVISIVGVAGGSVIGEESPALHEYGAAVGVNVPEGSEPVSYSIGLTSETIERVRDRYLSAHLKSENASQLFGITSAGEYVSEKSPYAANAYEFAGGKLRGLLAVRDTIVTGTIQISDNDGDGVWDGEDAFPLDPELSEVTVQGVVKDNLVLSSDENVGVGQGTLIKGNVKGTSDNYIRLLPDVTVEGNFEGISKVVLEPGSYVKGNFVNADYIEFLGTGSHLVEGSLEVNPAGALMIKSDASVEFKGNVYLHEGGLNLEANSTLHVRGNLECTNGANTISPEATIVVNGNNTCQ